MSWSVLPGKVMFRDIAYITTDYTVRVQDGFLIFRWWRKYVPKDASEDLSHSDTRASLQLNGFEYHVYNRSSIYRDLERKFCLEPRLFGFESDEDHEEGSKEGLQECSIKKGNSNDTVGKKGKDWRDLVPVIKVDISSGKVVFGNRTLPTTLVFSFEEGRCTYSTKPAACSLDHWMHSLTCKAENFKVLLASSPKYTGLRDEAPRYMGEGFVVASSNEVDVYYYMDEAGVVPENNFVPNIENDTPNQNDTCDSSLHPFPEWGINIKCGKGTNFCYGPWADRQREQIYKFFYPHDYQNHTPTPMAKAGDKRQAPIFRLRLSTQHSSTFDILFSKQKKTENIHLEMKPGTNFEIKIPYDCSPTGFTTNFNGTLMMAEATTSLPYRDLIRCETFHINLDMNYPLSWNAHQEWKFRFTASKTSLNFIFAHKWFFQEMIDDWSSKSAPDLLFYVPYTWKFEFVLKEFELITLANEFNWIDTSSTNTENTHLAICGNLLNVKFDLPYTEFLPQIIPFHFEISGQKLDLAVYLPETTSSRDILWSLDSNAKILVRDGNLVWKKEQNKGKWRSEKGKNGCSYEDGWIDCWTAPKVALDIYFDFHPTPIPGPFPEADISETEKETELLNPLRVPHNPNRPTTSQHSINMDALVENFDPALMKADKCRVQLRLDASTAYLYGTLIRLFMHVKENLFGEDQQFTPMDNSTSNKNMAFHTSGKVKNDRSKSNTKLDDKTVNSVEISDEFDPRMYRPIEVILDISVTNLQAHLIKHCSDLDPPCPFLTVETLICEMDKTYRETRLQVQLSPVILRSCNAPSSGVQYNTVPGRSSDIMEEQVSQGHCLLTGLQFRGNAMFSELDRPLGSDTLEYSWLIEVQCGTLMGKITASQLYNIFVAVESFVFLAVDKENVLKHPRSYKLCQHMENQKECTVNSEETEVCHTVEDLKYRLVRFAADALDLIIVEKSSALRLQACPVRFSTCNLHGLQAKQGVTALVNDIRLQQYISSNFPLSRSDTDPQIHHQDIWIESGVIRLGPIHIEGAVSGHSSQNQNIQASQHNFLQRHDQKTQRLWFLWPKSVLKTLGVPKEAIGNCGCVGGCCFFGFNENGVRFFSPSHIDISKRRTIAIPSLGDRSKNPGYGQSIIHSSHLNIHNTKIFSTQFLNLEEQILPPKWPKLNREPTKLPFCPDYRTHKSSSSNNSGDTPSHPKYHRSFSGKHGTPTSELLTTMHASGPSSEGQRYRSLSACINSMDRQQDRQKKKSFVRNDHLQSLNTPTVLPDEQVRADSNKSTSTLGQEEPDFKSTTEPTELFDVPSIENRPCPNEDGRYPLTRTESLVSDVLSFYSMDGDDAISQSKVSMGGTHTAPVSPRISLLSSEGASNYATSAGTTNYETASSNSEWKHLSFKSGSTQYMTAENGTLSSQNTNSEVSSITLSPTSTQYKTASQGLSSLKDYSLGISSLAGDNTSSQISFDTATLQPESPNLRESQGHEENELNGQSYHGKVENPRQEDTMSHNLSEGSYISAQSENGEFGQVNLQLQVEKPITESPLLMSSYISHLTQLRCSNYVSNVSSVPDEVNQELNGQERGKDLTGSSKRMIKSPLEYFPFFDVLEEGFSSINMVDRESDTEAQIDASFDCNSKNNNSPSESSNQQTNSSSQTSPGSWSSEQHEMSLLVDSNTAKTTLIVRFKGSVDVVLSPIVLESFQRIFEAITPALQTIHPLSVINHLHSDALGRVESKNTLKKEKSLELQDKLVVDTTGRDGGRAHGLARGLMGRRLRSTAKDTTGSAPSEMLRTFEKSISSYVQASLHLPKVNLMVLQASVVEDMCSFSALDAVRDITCVSLLAMSIRETTFQFCKMSQSKKAVQVYLQKQRIMSSKGRKKSKYKVAAITDSRQNEPMAFESSETQREEILLTGSLQKMHAQLRRLKNDSSILKDAFITAIPHNKSKVFFEYMNVPKLSSFRTTTPTEAEGSSVNKQYSAGKLKVGITDNDQTNASRRSEESKLGFNMCECGFEGINVKIAKRSSNQMECPETSHQTSPSEDDAFHSDDGDADKSSLKGEDYTTIDIENTQNEQDKDESISNSIEGQEMQNIRTGITKTKSSSSIKSDGQRIPKRGEESFNHSYSQGVEKSSKEDGIEPVPSDSPKKKDANEHTKNEDVTNEGKDSTPETKHDNVEHCTENEYSHGGKHSSSSGSVELKTSWFNFAAPPKTPISRKIDFTKMDWNLLSTASPSIDVWFNAVDRLQKDVSVCLNQVRFN